MKRMKKSLKRPKKRAAKPRLSPAVALILWRRLQEGGVIVLSALAIFLFVALATYHETDSGWSRAVAQLITQNAAGRLGAWFSDLFLTLFGYLAYMLPAMIAYGSLRLFHNRFQTGYFNRLLWGLRVAGFLLALAAGCGLTSLHFNFWTQGLPYTAGGILGQVVMQIALLTLGLVGGTLVLLAVFLAGITLATGLSWFGVMDSLSARFAEQVLALPRQTSYLWTQLKNIRNLKRFCKNIFTKKDTENKTLALKKRSDPPLALLPPAASLPPPTSGKSWKNFFLSKTSTENPDIKEEVASPSPAMMQAARKTNTASSAIGNLASKSSQKPLNTAGLPAITLLNPADPQRPQQAFSVQKLEALSREVEARLLEFGVQVSVVGVYPGPVITRFELELAAGLKVSKITGLSKDLARALSVTRVRVVEVIPGKSVVGLEIPNTHRELVTLREILESPLYEESSSPLTLALGKDIAGEPAVVSLNKMPHLLVAGTTGSGKSVGVNIMLLSLLFKATPEEVRLILIDPKMLELSIYDGIPHLLTPVVTDMKDAANVLKWCVGEMERRYQLMATLGVRNLLGFNRKIEEAEAAGKPLLNPLLKDMGPDQPVLEKLAYIVIIIDEFADMMMVVGKKVEELIARIAQKARAAGIHMILATQRPSVDVITGLIKANVPTRIAYQVSSRIDSRTILDQQGAEQLLGHGDMLYLAPGAGIPTRIHGAFVSDEEVHTVVKALKQLGEPDYEEDILGSGGMYSWGGSFSGLEDEEGGEQDGLYDQAVAIVIESRRSSISHLQRRLKIGYNRAARLIESMEAAGVVGPMQSNGGREVLVGNVE